MVSTTTNLVAGPANRQTLIATVYFCVGLFRLARPTFRAAKRSRRAEHARCMRRRLQAARLRSSLGQKAEASEQFAQLTARSKRQADWAALTVNLADFRAWQAQKARNSPCARQAHGLHSAERVESSRFDSPESQQYKARLHHKDQISAQIGSVTIWHSN